MLDRPLTRVIGRATAGVLDLTASRPDGYSTRMAMDTVFLDGAILSTPAVDIYRGERRTLRVADACNGLEMMVLYVGFLICFPAPAKRKWLYAIIGLVAICLVNIIRCAALVEIFIHYNKYLDFSHHFAFTFLVYGFIFLLWYLFTKNLRLNGRPV